MDVTVKLFAGLRERAGADEIEVTLPDGARVAAPDAAWPYGEMPASATPEALELIPYAWWGNRGEAGMSVWIPVSP